MPEKVNIDAVNTVVWNTLIEPHRNFPSVYKVRLLTNVDRSEWQHLEGKEFSVRPKSLYVGTLHAAPLELPEDIPCEAKHPYLLLSWDDGEDTNQTGEQIMNDYTELNWPGFRIDFKIQFNELEPLKL